MTQKIGFLGLDAAGKSAFISVLTKSYASLSKLLPTKGIERSQTDIMGQKIDLWDYGGQKAYRDRYLTSNKDLEALDLAFFLVDIQNPDRYYESVEYLQKIIERMPDFNQKNLIVCFHKHDPNMRKDLQKNIRDMWNQMEEAVEEAFAFIPTSIYDENSIHRAFSMGLRQIATKKEIVEQELLSVCKDIGLTGAIILNKEGFVLASQIANQDLKEQIESIGVGFVNIAQSNGSEFKELVGKTDNGDFRLELISTGANEYYTFCYGKSEGINFDGIKKVLRMFG